MNDILGLMLGLIALLILIKHLLPSLSSFFKEKIMGMRPSESFDLDQLIEKKKNLYQIKQAEGQDLFEKNLELKGHSEALSFVQSFSWDAQSSLAPLLSKGQEMAPDRHLTLQKMRQTYQQLKDINDFEKGPALELETLKNFILFYSLFFPELNDSEQRQSFFDKTCEEVAAHPEELATLYQKYQADFSAPPKKTNPFGP